jgi:hypothetical protein
MIGRRSVQAFGWFVEAKRMLKLITRSASSASAVNATERKRIVLKIVFIPRCCDEVPYFAKFFFRKNGGTHEWTRSNTNKKQWEKSRADSVVCKK